MKDQQDNTTDIAVLQAHFETMDEKMDEHIIEDKINFAAIQNTQKEILDQFKLFTNAIKTGKWVFITILLSLGAMAHKSVAWFLQFLPN